MKNLQLLTIMVVASCSQWLGEIQYRQSINVCFNGLTQKAISYDE